MKSKFVIYRGHVIFVKYGHENWKEFIIVGDDKIFEAPTQFIEYTKEGLNRVTYIDCVTPVDKYGVVINVGDRLYASVKGEVVVVTVTKIAEKPYHLGYGCHARKLTVKDTDSDKTWVLPEGSRCIKTL